MTKSAINPTTFGGQVSTTIGFSAEVRSLTVNLISNGKEAARQSFLDIPEDSVLTTGSLVLNPKSGATYLVTCSADNSLILQNISSKSILTSVPIRELAKLSFKLVVQENSSNESSKCEEVGSKHEGN